MRSSLGVRCHAAVKQRRPAWGLCHAPNRLAPDVPAVPCDVCHAPPASVPQAERGCPL